MDDLFSLEDTMAWVRSLSPTDALIIEEHYSALFQLRDALREAMEDHYVSGDYVALGMAAQDAMRAYEKVD